MRRELFAHIAGPPSVTQRALIEQVVQLKLRLALMDEKFAATGVQTDHDTRTYLAWANSYGRMLSRLGIQPPRGQNATLADYLDSTRRRPEGTSEAAD